MTILCRRAASAFSLALVLSLAGCGDDGVPEIKLWMDGVREQTKVAIPTLSPPKKFTPFSYEAKNLVDPYSPSKLAIAFAKLQSNSSGMKPDMERRREPLEAYPLDVLKMVGTLQKPGLNYALILADKTLFQVKAGSHLGQNFGMVSGITETAVELKEIVQDASGEWVERKAKLELQEAKK